MTSAPASAPPIALTGFTKAAWRLCIHNPSTGREETQPHAITPAATKRQVVVVGAGPAGLEAARVAADAWP